MVFDNQTEDLAKLNETSGELTGSSEGDSSIIISMSDSSLSTTLITHVVEQPPVAIWGNSNYGGAGSPNMPSNLLNVISIFSTKYAFAAITNKGKVVTWGQAKNGGDPNNDTNNQMQDKLVAVDVASISSNDTAFATITKIGSVVTWGKGDNGGDLGDDVQSPKYISNISSSYAAFAAF